MLEGVGRGKGMGMGGEGASRLPCLLAVHCWASDDSNPCRAPCTLSAIASLCALPWGILFQSLPGSSSLSADPCSNSLSTMASMFQSLPGSSSLSAGRRWLLRKDLPMFQSLPGSSSLSATDEALAWLHQQMSFQSLPSSLHPF